jgi:PhzF family phenazine biosynthesis protein
MHEPTIVADGVLRRLAAFTTDPAGGNPAGVWIGDVLPVDDRMQQIAAEVGYSETAFLAPDPTAVPDSWRVRYFSPLAEVPFCGHATIASGIALAEHGRPLDPTTSATSDASAGSAASPASFSLRTNDGIVGLVVGPDDDGHLRTTLTSVAAAVYDAPSLLLDRVLTLLGWPAEALDPSLPPAIGYAGARHLILAVRDLSTLASLEYPFEPMQRVMLEHDLTTLQLVWREGVDMFRARDPFPVGGVVEDPATGAAAAALGAYLRERGELVPPATFQIRQGVEMGRPSLLTVTLEPGEPGVLVSGTAVDI